MLTVMILLTARGCLLSSVLCLLPLCKVARPLRRAFATCLPKCPLSFVPGRQYSVSCKGSPLQYSDYNLRGCHSPHLHVRRSSVEHQLGLVSPSSRSSAQASRTYAFATWRMKDAVRAVRSRRFPALQWMPPIVLRARSWYTPIRPQLVAKTKSMSPPTYVEPYLGDASGRGRDGRESSALSHREINTITNRSHQYYFFV